MLSRKKRAGMCHHPHELFTAIIMLIGILIAVLWPVVRGFRDGVRNCFNAQEILDASIIYFDEGVFVAGLFLISMSVLISCFIGFMMAAGYIRRRWNRTTENSTTQSAESDATEPETSESETSEPRT